ncbi:hypothetical protein SAMN06296010_1200 [Agreia pratensis]|uniref:DUF4352 domain-containing protein n=1 Tax=Agreia pratensis TaxID=150121 RepID=A0A1X7JAH9_9MICO|nr:hypothetical protein SAMN06296010_1200 [Agreia pratensis]
MTYQEPGVGSQQNPPTYAQPQQPENPYLQPGHRPSPGRNILALVAFIASIVGFIFSCIPGALIVGWILLPIAFILAIVSLFLKGTGKGLGIAGLIISVVGTIVAFVVFFAVVATSFNDAFGDKNVTIDEPASSSQAPADEAQAEDAKQEPAGEAGTRESPVAVGSVITGDDWTIVINSFNPDGAAVVAEANQFNEVAPAGSHYGIVNYTVTYTGEDSAYAVEVGVDMVTGSGNVINGYDALVVLNDSIGLGELFTGASATGSAAFVIPDGETALIRVRPGMLADDIFVSP